MFYESNDFYKEARITLFDYSRYGKVQPEYALEEILRMMADRTWKDAVASLRNCEDFRQKDFLKKRLPAYFTSLYSPEVLDRADPTAPGGIATSQSNCLKANFLANDGVSIIDIDHNPRTCDDAVIADLAEVARTLPYVICTFTSPSGKGLKIMLRHTPSTDREEYSGMYKDIFSDGKLHPLIRKYADKAVVQNPFARCYVSDGGVWINDSEPEILEVKSTARVKVWIDTRTDTEKSREERLLEFVIRHPRFAVDPSYDTYLALAAITATYNRKDLFLYAIEHAMKWEDYTGSCKSWTPGYYHEATCSRKWDVVKAEQEYMVARSINATKTVKSLYYLVARLEVPIADVPADLRGIISFLPKPTFDDFPSLAEQCKTRSLLFTSLIDRMLENNMIKINLDGPDFPEKLNMIMQAAAQTPLHGYDNAVLRVLYQNGYTGPNEALKFDWLKTLRQTERNLTMKRDVATWIDVAYAMVEDGDRDKLVELCGGYYGK